MAPERIWSDKELAAAIKAEHSWRGVGRRLGLKSASATRGLRSWAIDLGIDYSHFTGQRTWSDAALAQAIATSSSWSEVSHRLGLRSDSAKGTIKAHSRRLGLDDEHLNRPAPEFDELLHGTKATIGNIRHAAVGIAVAWFALRGWTTSTPAEGCVYDLVADVGGLLWRIQVKTATHRGRYGEWVAQIARARRNGLTVLYDPDSIDFFFVIDGDLELYLIPIEVVAGQRGLNPGAYGAYRVGSARSLMAP